MIDGDMAESASLQCIENGHNVANLNVFSLYDDTDDDGSFANADEDEDSWYEALTPSKEDNEYFNSVERQALFRSLLNVDDLQFSVLDITKQIELMESIVVRRFKKGQIIYNTGDDTREFFIILELPQAFSSSGDSVMTTPTKSKRRNEPQVEITKTVAATNETHNMSIWETSEPEQIIQQFITKLGRGDYFGYEHLVSNGAPCRTATVTALTDIELASVYPEDFHKWSYFRNTVIINKKFKIEEQVKEAKQQYEKEREKLCEEMEKLKQEYRSERKTLAARLEEVKVEIEETIGGEEYEAQLE